MKLLQDRRVVLGSKTYLINNSGLQSQFYKIHKNNLT